MGLLNIASPRSCRPSQIVRKGYQCRTGFLRNIQLRQGSFFRFLHFRIESNVLTKLPYLPYIIRCNSVVYFRRWDFSIDFSNERNRHGNPPDNFRLRLLFRLSVVHQIETKTRTERADILRRDQHRNLDAFRRGDRKGIVRDLDVDGFAIGDDDGQLVGAILEF